MKEALSGIHSLTWVADDRIERGGCIVEADERLVDGRVDVAIQALYQDLGHG